MHLSMDFFFKTRAPDNNSIWSETRRGGVVAVGIARLHFSIQYFEEIFQYLPGKATDMEQIRQLSPTNSAFGREAGKPENTPH